MGFFPTILALSLFLGTTTGTGWNGHVCEDLSATCALVAEYMALGFGSLCEVPDPSNPGQDYGYHCPLTCNRCVQFGMSMIRITFENKVTFHSSNYVQKMCGLADVMWCLLAAEIKDPTTNLWNPGSFPLMLHTPLLNVWMAQKMKLTGTFVEGQL